MTASWEDLNAYVDGELDAEKAAVVAAAIAGHPALAARVATLTRLKAVMTGTAMADRSSPLPLDLAAARRGRRRPWPMAAIAACVGAVVVAAAVLPFRPLPISPLDEAAALHRQWLALASQDDRSVHRIAATGIVPLPDLAAAGLTLTHVAVAHQGVGAGVLLSYLGRRGCQVSLWMTADAGDPPEFPDQLRRRTIDDLVVYAWRVAGRGYALLSRGMDEERLEALSAAVERITREGFRIDEPMRMALAETVDPSQPCRV